MAFLSSGFMFYSKSRSQVQQTDKQNGFATRICCRLVLPFFKVRFSESTDLCVCSTSRNTKSSDYLIFISLSGVRNQWQAENAMKTYKVHLL